MLGSLWILGTDERTAGGGYETAAGGEHETGPADITASFGVGGAGKSCAFFDSSSLTLSIFDSLAAGRLGSMILGT